MPTKPSSTSQSGPRPSSVAAKSANPRWESPRCRLQANRDCVGLNSSELESNSRMRRDTGCIVSLIG